MNSSTKTVKPVIFLVLGTENGRSFVMTAFNQFKNEMLFFIRNIIHKPFINNQKTIRTIFLEKPFCISPLNFFFIMLDQKIRKTNVLRRVSLLAGLSSGFGNMSYPITNLFSVPIWMLYPGLS